MNTIRAVFLLVLAAEASSTAIPPRKEKSVELCCDTKTVGDYNYTKVSTGKVPSNCLNNCIYTRDDKPGPKYCFASGDKEVHCQDSEAQEGGSDCFACIISNTPKCRATYETGSPWVSFGCLYLQYNGRCIDICYKGQSGDPLLIESASDVRKSARVVLNSDESFTKTGPYGDSIPSNGGNNFNDKLIGKKGKINQIKISTKNWAGYDNILAAIDIEYKGQKAVQHGVQTANSSTCTTDGSFVIKASGQSLQGKTQARNYIYKLGFECIQQACKCEAPEVTLYGTPFNQQAGTTQALRFVSGTVSNSEGQQFIGQLYLWWGPKKVADEFAIGDASAETCDNLCDNACIDPNDEDCCHDSLHCLK